MQELLHSPSEFEDWNSNLKAQTHECLLRLEEEARIVHNEIRPCIFGLSENQVLLSDLEDVMEKWADRSIMLS